MQFEISKFTWNRQTRVLSAEASDLGLHNAPGIGGFITIKGKEKVVIFGFKKLDRDLDGDIQGVWYENKAEDIHVLIIND